MSPIVSVLRRLCVVVAVPLLMAGCTAEPEIVEIKVLPDGALFVPGADAGGAGGDSGGEDTTAARDTGPADTGAAVDTAEQDTGQGDTAGSDGGLATQCPEAGGLGCPCGENDECLSGFCVPTDLGHQCTINCISECPDDWRCKGVNGLGPDIVFVCLPAVDVLCDPCTVDHQCGEGYCVTGPNDERACSQPCSDLADDQGEGRCPAGYACEVVTSEETGSVDEQCMPITGTCSCTPDNDGEIRPCFGQNEFGRCPGQTTCDAEVGWTECDAGVPALEDCDGVDNDCNGLADDGLLEPAQACELENGFGTCAGGWLCEGLGGWRCEVQTPTEEVCDFLDNDCNGEVDEGFRDAASGEYSTLENCGVCGNDCTSRFGVGAPACVEGQCEVESCPEGFFLIPPFTCAPLIASVCLPCSTDANCTLDGDVCVDLADGKFCGEDCSATSVRGTECPAGFSCAEVATDVHQCVPSSGTCSCLPENDGLVRPCLIGNDAGTCFGEETCDDALGWTGCSARTPTVEVCNGVDDDCNALPDDVAGRGGACVNDNEFGECGGALECVEGVEALQCVGQVPAAEVCNYADDDCDSEVDEGFAGLFSSCSLGDGICRRFGFVECSSGGAAAACNAVPGDEETEVCDGFDNDCDGVVDEEARWSDLGGLCEEGLGVCATAGIYRCDAVTPGGDLVCDAAPPAGSAEICDGQDNDCDGFVDNGLPAGEPCQLQLGVCAGATRTCQGPLGYLPCLPGDYGDDYETSETLCDGKDNDCDGVTDEVDLDGDLHVALACAATYSGDLDADDCDDGDALVRPGGSETCNGKDDDCDAETDEVDRDGDGDIDAACFGTYSGSKPATDCDDLNPLRSPTKAEVCDNVDNDCNGEVDDRDADGDLHVDQACASGYIGLMDADDCDDTPGSGAARNPALAEVCDDGVDNDCDGIVDNLDADEDGFVSNGVGCNLLGRAADCDDGDPAVNPGQAEVCNNPVDEDCSGGLDDRDLDGDGFFEAGCGAGPYDCDDGEPRVSPAELEVCGDSLDNDCDGGTDNRDLDRDGDPAIACGGGDCDDLNALAKSVGQDEICGDGQDNDCNGEADDKDVDGDMHIDALCAAGYTAGVFPADDCDDTAATGALANPELDEACGDAVDNDCDGSVDNQDLDGDKVISLACGGTDCNDDPAVGAAVQPGAIEVCDGLDNDCGGVIDDKDLDVDGHVDAACTLYAGPKPIDDCDDANVGVNPEQDEVCGNAIDEDCTGAIDDRDVDADGVISDAVLCGGSDCDDGDPMVYPGAVEVRDGKDNECSEAGLADEGLIGPGDLLVTEFLYDSSQTPDENYEWFEVYNPTDRPIEMQGWAIHDDAGEGGGQEVSAVDASVRVPARGFAVLCRTGDPANNGGVECDYQYGFVQLGNGEDELKLSVDYGAAPGTGGTLIQEICYDEDFADAQGEWPCVNQAAGVWTSAIARSLILDPDTFGVDENLATNWCRSPTGGPALPNTDEGSPGVSNVSCTAALGTPQVVGAHPDNGLAVGGTTVRLVGAGFVGVTMVQIGGVPCAIAALSDDEITCTTGGPMPAGALDIVVTEGGSSDTLSGAFTATSSAPAALDGGGIVDPGALRFVRGTWSPLTSVTLTEGGVTGAGCPASREYPRATLRVEMGYGPAASDPRADGTWTWHPAFCASSAAGSDTFDSTVRVATPGPRAAAFRASVDGGATWTYIDLDGVANGFQPAQALQLDVR